MLCLLLRFLVLVKVKQLMFQTMYVNFVVYIAWKDGRFLYCAITLFKFSSRGYGIEDGGGTKIKTLTFIASYVRYDKNLFEYPFVSTFLRFCVKFHDMGPC